MPQTITEAQHAVEEAAAALIQAIEHRDRLLQDA